MSSYAYDSTNKELTLVAGTPRSRLNTMEGEIADLNASLNNLVQSKTIQSGNTDVNGNVSISISLIPANAIVVGAYCNNEKVIPYKSSDGNYAIKFLNDYKSGNIVYQVGNASHAFTNLTIYYIE